MNKDANRLKDEPVTNADTQNRNDTNRYLLLWSGGCDSTLLLHRYLKEGKKIRTLAINHDQVLSGPYEKKARKKIREKLRERGLTFHHQEITIKGNGSSVNGGGLGLPQSLLWLPLAVSNLHDKEKLLTAYIREDDIWHYRYWYVESFRNMLVMVGKTSELLFPMEWDMKAEIIDGLKKARLLSLTWYCEIPAKSGKKCCRKCASCKKMLTNK